MSRLSPPRRFHALFNSLIASSLLGACALVGPPSAEQCARCGETAQSAPQTAPSAPMLSRADWSDLPGWDRDPLDGAWAALLQSCASGRWRNGGDARANPSTAGFPAATPQGGNAGPAGAAQSPVAASPTPAAKPGTGTGTSAAAALPLAASSDKPLGTSGSIPASGLSANGLPTNGLSTNGLSTNGQPARPDWAAACAAAGTLPANPTPAAVRTFFEQQFVPWAIANPDGSREGTVTGYYEPLLVGSRKKEGAFRVPIYAVPDDLLTIDMGDLFPELKGKRVRGRLDGKRVVPYYDRGGIRARAAELRDKVLVWSDDPVEVFFLQIQGSGRVRLPDGSLMRIGYADQNGHPYNSIGRLLVERGELTLDQASMQGIQNWGRNNHDKLEALLDANPSFVFFRELQAGDQGPLGALGVPLTAGRSIAVDPSVVPLGAPIFLATTEPNTTVPMNRLVFAQDTGGAIKGAVRADFFWGFGPEAGAMAGRMRQSGKMWALLPRPKMAPLASIARQDAR